MWSIEELGNMTMKMIVVVLTVVIIRKIVKCLTKFDVFALASDIIRILKFALFKPKEKKRFGQLKKKITKYCSSRGVKIYIEPVYFPERINQLAIGTPKNNMPLIAYSSFWLEKVTSPLWEMAFVQSVGHELGHRFDLPSDEINGKSEPDKMRFFCWVRECRCDFYGIHFAKAMYLQCTRDDIIEAVVEKSEVYKPTEEERAKPTEDHPSWNFRIYLATKYLQFNAETVREIAEEAGYKDRKYIEVLAQRAILNEYLDPIICPENTKA